MVKKHLFTLNLLNTLQGDMVMINKMDMRGNKIYFNAFEFSHKSIALSQETLHSFTKRLWYEVGGKNISVLLRVSKFRESFSGELKTFALECEIFARKWYKCKKTIMQKDNFSPISFSFNPFAGITFIQSEKQQSSTTIINSTMCAHL